MCQCYPCLYFIVVTQSFVKSFCRMCTATANNKPPKYPKGDQYSGLESPKSSGK